MTVNKEQKREMTDLAAGEQTDADANAASDRRIVDEIKSCTSPKFASTGLKGKVDLDYEGDGFTDVKASDVVSTAFVAQASPPMVKPGLAPGFVGGEEGIRPPAVAADNKEK